MTPQMSLPISSKSESEKNQRKRIGGFCYNQRQKCIHHNPESIALTSKHISLGLLSSKKRNLDLVNSTRVGSSHPQCPKTVCASFFFFLVCQNISKQRKENDNTYIEGELFAINENVLRKEIELDGWRYLKKPIFDEFSDQ
jgi:hypothetical protein